MLKISVINGGEKFVLNAYRGEKISEVIKRAGIGFFFPCGEKGKCGKCVVKVSNAYPFCSMDIKLLGEDNVKNGLRLLCQMKAVKDVEIELNYNNKFDILDSFNKKYLNYISDEKGYGVCVDIGTTTVAAQLIRLSDGEIIHKYGKVNSQNIFGADVISRIEASENGKKDELKNAVRKDIIDCIKSVCVLYKKEEIKKITLAGNTAMIYLLLGKSCKKISAYPFECDFNELKEYNFFDIFESNEFECKVCIINCLSAFVGGDIVSGIIFCNLLENKNCLFIDIGTNAEMAIFNGNKLFVLSAAAGPAFEGGNISCGVGGVRGAIFSAKLENNIWSYETIGKEKACGICGSGLIDIIASLLENNIIDNSGLLKEDYFYDGVKIGRNIKLVQNDIREFQLAKSAVRAGIKILIREAGIKFDKIEKVFLAGGFGFKININSAFKTGIFPKEFKGKIKSIGNSSLGGLRDIILNKNKEYINNIKNITVPINLAQVNEFNQFFMEEINF